MADDGRGQGGIYAGETAGRSIEQYRRLVNAVGDGIYQLDPDGRFVAANDVIAEVTGYGREELLGSHVSLVLDDPDVARIEAMIHTMVTHGLPGTTIDVPIETRTGEVIPCELRPSLLTEDGEFAGTVGVVRDVTERTGVSPTVTTVTGRYESLVKDVLDVAGVGVAVVDADGQVAWVNEATETYFGFDRTDVLGRDEREVVDEYVRAAVADPDAFGAGSRGLSPAGDEGAEFQIAPGDGRPHRWLVHRSNPIETGRYAGGRVVLYYDVTDRKQSEQVARERQKRLDEEQAFTESLLDAQPDIVYAIDRDGRPIRWNDRVPAITGYSDAEIAWMEAQEFVAEDARLDALEAMAPVIEDGESTTVELPLLTKGGETIPYQFTATPLTDEDGEVVGLTGVGRDISRLKEQARRLERQRDELEAELAEVFDRIDDAFFALDEALRFTYVNDRAESLLAGDSSEVLGATVDADAHVTGAAVEAIETAFADQVQVTVEDYVPGLDAWIESHVYPSETGVSVYFRDVSEREHRKQELESQRERLAALDDLNGVVREITDAVLDQSTRDQIETVVVEGLAGSNSYAAAWIGAADAGSESIAVRTAAGYGGGLDGSTVRADPAVERPAGRALASGEIQVCRGGPETDCSPAAGDGAADSLRSAAAIPIGHKETVYGVLTVHTGREGAFSAEEREVIGHVGEIVGHAIAAVERKRALAADEMIEVDFRVENAFDSLDLPAPADGIAIEQSIPVDDGQYRVYGTAAGSGRAALDAVAEADPATEGLRWISEEGESRAFELCKTEPPLSMDLATRGATLASAVVEDGNYLLTVRLPPGVDVRAIRDLVTDEYPDATLLAQRQVSRPTESAHRIVSALESELTDRQRTVLQAAYFGGYFEWPRGSTGEELAESLDIAPATFSQHLRTAQRRLFGVLVDDDAPVFE